MNRIVFNVKEVAKCLYASESTIRKLVREKRIPHLRILSKILLDKEQVDKRMTNNQMSSN